MNNGFRNNLETNYNIRKKQQREEFLNEVRQMADREFLTLSGQLKEDFNKKKEKLRKELSETLTLLYNQYKSMRQRGETGALRWIYFSFLRSSRIDGYPAYRIDFYDARDCYSYTECCVSWDFAYVFSGFHRIKETIMDVFRRQNKVKEYDADGILNELYEKFHILAAGFLKELLQENGLSFLHEDEQRGIGIREGELFDKTDQIIAKMSYEN